MKHIVLLGDSIFDNKSYVNGGKDTVANLREQMPDNWTATLLAIDGSVASSVATQLQRVPDGATHLFLSVGGNDALAAAGILQMPASSAADVFSELASVSARFEANYKSMLDAVRRLSKLTAVCTIYYPNYPEPRFQKIAVAALSSFNDVIIRQATLNGIPIIDLRYVCTDAADYANPIEPSESGGAKIAKSIIQVVREHEFGKKATQIYSGPTSRATEIEHGPRPLHNDPVSREPDASADLLTERAGADRGYSVAVERTRTSETHPIRVDFIHSSEQPILNRIGMTFAPGKKQADAFSGTWDRDLRADLERLSSEFDVNTLVSLVENDELDHLQIRRIGEECDAARIKLVRFPIRDISVPQSMDDFVAMVADAVESLAHGETVVAHCKGGLGRAGLTAACVAVAATDAGVTANDAIALVRHARPGSIETEEQEEFVRKFANRWRDLKAAQVEKGSDRDNLGQSVDDDRRNTPEKGARQDSIKVHFIRSSGFPVLHRLGMVFAAGVAFTEESETERLDLGEYGLTHGDDVTFLRLSVQPDVPLRPWLTELIPMVARFEKALRQGDVVVAHCKDRPECAAIAAACIAIGATSCELNAADAMKAVQAAHPVS